MDTKELERTKTAPMGREPGAIAVCLTRVLVPALLTAVLSPVQAAERLSGDTPEQRDARIAWWREARFGMFIHFGLYAIPGRGEWVQWNEQIPVEEYARLADQFNPTDFTPDSWAELAKSAGMKYVVLTSRHHDGFCLFDDGENPFTSVRSAAHRDIVAEYVRAVRRTGLRVGLYYSPLDWRYPGFFFPDLQRRSAEAMREQYHRQVKELLSNYGKIDVLWFDGGEADWLNFGADWSGAQWKKRPANQHYHGGFSWRHDEVYTMLRRLQPDILINNRADMSEDFHSREGSGQLGPFDNRRPWELCVTIAGAWGYQPNKLPKPLKDYIQLLAKVAGRDGNLLLNVGPDPNGRIDPPQAQRLREIGEWLRKYGQSIYATRGGPFLPGDYGVSTHRDNKIYLHILNWPTDKLALPALPAKVLRASVLTGGDATRDQNADRIEIAVAPPNRNEIDTIVVLELDQPASGVKPIGVSAR
jgi:alpha-L-fucosidase